MASRGLRRDPVGTALAVVFLGLGVFMVVRSIEMTDMGAVFPRAIGIAMALLSAALVARNLLSTGKKTPAAEAPGVDGPSQWRRLALIGILVAWAFGMTRLGFFVTAALGMMLLVFVASFEPLSPKRILVYAVSVLAIVVGAYLLFVRALLVPAPSGFLI